jgi:hypothetical protein
MGRHATPVATWCEDCIAVQGVLSKVGVMLGCRQACYVDISVWGLLLQAGCTQYTDVFLVIHRYTSLAHQIIKQASSLLSVFEFFSMWLGQMVGPISTCSVHCKALWSIGLISVRSELLYDGQVTYPPTVNIHKQTL